MDEEFSLDLPPIESVGKNLSLHKAIHEYLTKAKALESYLRQKPDDWYKYQDDMNAILDSISKEIGRFEKSNARNEQKIYKLKQFFVKRLRKYFLFGHYITWSLNKPYGYAGDFQIIDDIYTNKPFSKGIERLWDNYFLRMGPSIATRNRKEDFKRIIIEFLKERNTKSIKIMDLASGPCRDIKELYDEWPAIMERVDIDCYDFDDHAIAFAKRLLEGQSRITFFKKNALRMSLKKEIKDEIPFEYDLIFSTGLFDYLDDRIAVRLIANLKRLLKPKGMMCISNYTNKDNNPWAYLMEWVAEWNLIYRTEADFKKVFIDGGFKTDDIEMSYEPLKLMQYCFARIG